MSLSISSSLRPARVVALGTTSLMLVFKVAENPASMIWYLLYPFRGTTEAPVLDQKHPLRHAFTRYGHKAAQRPIITLLIFIAAAVVLIFPFPFLYTNDFTNGSSNLPHHVWTSAQPLEGPPTTLADVVMRSIWVHGSYMKALQADVFLSALEIQNYILGSTLNFDPRRPENKIHQYNPMKDLTIEMRDALHTINGLSNESWFFHSPLQYWSCSKENIESDQDILTTINQSSRQATSVNVTLRHSIVFSGKRFEERRLVAADALVITLVHMLDSPVGKQWERKAEELALKSSNKWHLYPADGRSHASTLYEFRFQPLSLPDDLFFGAAYGLTFIYVVISLSKLQAFRSRFGLILAVIAHISVSIMASFTVCAIFKVDLSQIPREIYPLVVLTVGLENIFRFINAVIMARSEDSTAAQIGEALGKTGHVALAGVSQNLAILWILSRGVYPQIRAFCTFSAVALTFDFLFLLTFFVAVLSVDVKRMELSDALSEAALNNSHLNAPTDDKSGRTWIDALIHGDAPLSTRTAGTFVLIGFIFMAQWHLFENESFLQTASRLFRLSKSDASFPQSASASLLSLNIHQARSPNAWLRMQDHETAHEVIQIVKPYANSYIARVYDPLVFVLNGSDRTPNEFGVRPFLPAAYDFVKHQFGVFLFTILFTVAAVSLFLSYLLWDELPKCEGRGQTDNQPLISIVTLNRGHALDIVLLTTSNEGLLATVGLDRWVRVWNVREQVKSYVVYDQARPLDPFPVLAIAIDSDSKWLAILSAKDMIYLWNICEQRWGPSMYLNVGGRAPVGFFFGHHRSDYIKPLIVVQKNGLMSELQVGEGEEKHTQISHHPLVCVRRLLDTSSAMTNPRVHVLSVSRKGCIYITREKEEAWITKSIEVREPTNDQRIMSVLPIPSLTSILAIRGQTVDLVDMLTGTVSYTFSTQEIQANSLKFFYSSRRRTPCGSIGLCSLALAYNCAKTGSCIMQIYLPQREGDLICKNGSCRPGGSTCCAWDDTSKHQFKIDNPGQWEALQSGYLVGVRKRETSQTSGHMSFLGPNSSVRRRGMSFTHMPSNVTEEASSEQELWEVWAISARGERYSQPLCSLAEKDHLLISNLGPLRVMGRHSVVVALGNMAKVISVGIEKFDGNDICDDTPLVGMTPARIARRKRPHPAGRKSH